MTRTKPEVLLFDLGGVLVEIAIFEELPKLLSSSVERDEVRRRWLFSPAVQAFERGETGADAFIAAFIAEWGLKLGPAEFLAAYETWLRGPYPGALELLERLRRDYRIAVLSNCNAVHWRQLERVRGLAHVAYSSHLLGLVKPDVAIFRHVVSDLGVEPDQICFFDDTPPNVEAARAAGLRAYQTEGLEALELTLRTLEI